MNDSAMPVGLTPSEAATRLAADGPNSVAQAGRQGLFHLVGHVATEPMFLLLIAASSVYLVLGDLAEALALAASIVVVLAITVVQERRTERTLERLRDLSSPRALVIRGGVECRIAGADVVRGDLMLLREGDRVAADGTMVESNGLEADESLLTGESVPVRKETAADAQVYAGTLVVRGTGRAVVTATGPRSQLGRIGTSLAGLDPGETSLQLETGRIVRYIAAAAAVLCVAVAALYVAARGNVLEGVLAGLTLAMSILPEEFPVVLTVFLALGAWRISRQGVLTRRMPAIEMLGATTVLCCDKTGTLTENRMRVLQAWSDGSWKVLAPLDARQGALLAAAAMACEQAPYDPMERAILEASEPWAPEPASLSPPEVRYPLTDRFLAVAMGYRVKTDEADLALKGAPETVATLCGLDAATRQGVLDATADAAQRGLRVLGVARTTWRAGAFPSEPQAYDWRFLGLIALADPLRSSVPHAIATCRRAGIRVVMITGDHPATARAIGRQAGLDAEGVMTGQEISALDPNALAQAVRKVEIFARVRPEQKLALVTALRASGEIVAMTGDGVNDAPALRAAHIGVAMGRRGTDVAREAAALVLLQDDFTAMVSTIRLGRRIYDNIRNAMAYLVAVHVPLAGMALLPLALGWPVFLFPLHVVFLEFVIDPACTLAFEAEHSDAAIMERPPRPPQQRLFTLRMLFTALALGAAAVAVVAAVYGIALARGAPEGTARALAFTTLVWSNLALIVAHRSERLTALELLGRRNPVLWSIVAAASMALGLVVYWPPLAVLFHFEAPPATAELAAAAAGLALLAISDLPKYLRRGRLT